MARAPGKRIRSFLWAALILVVAAALLGPIVPFDLDSALIRAERSRRLAYAVARAQLPGTPDLSALPKRLAASGHALGAPILLRIFKREFELEVWLKREDRFELFETYPICRWSGRLGPKIRQGDKQAPEGFYAVDAKALNPASRWHRSFNLGFPNAYDRAHDRTGTYLMVHGGCSSEGCYAMTNPVIDEIWQLVTAALRAGQKAFQVQVYPFRMTPDRLEGYKSHPHHGFWTQLKRGYELFEAHGQPLRVRVCSGRYEFELPAKPAASAERIVAGCADQAGSAILGTGRDAGLNADL